MKHLARVVLLVLCLLGAARAAEVKVAVAANFTAPMKKIADAFAAASGHKALLSFGATGDLYAQIKSGAPFDMLLAADEQTPLRLEREGLAVPGTRFTYAMGRLVLWSAIPGVVDDEGQVLRNTSGLIGVPNPKLAPYGAAAVDAMSRLGLLKSLQPRFVQGADVAQIYRLVAAGNVPLGFVALSQVMQEGRITNGSAWVVPYQFHAQIRQDGVVLAAGKDNEAAAALAKFLKGDRAHAVISAYGYRY